MAGQQCDEILRIKERKDGSFDMSQCSREAVCSYTDESSGEERTYHLCTNHRTKFLKSLAMGRGINTNADNRAGKSGPLLQKIGIETLRRAEQLDPDGSLRLNIRTTTNEKIVAKQESQQAGLEADLLLEVSMFRETMPLLWQLIRRKIYDNNENLPIEDIGMVGCADGTGSIDGPIPRMAEIQKHIEWFIDTYDLEWPDIGSEDIWTKPKSPASKKWANLQRGAAGAAGFEMGRDEFGDWFDV